MFDFSKAGFNDPVTAAEDRPICPDLIEAGPEGLSMWVFHDNPIELFRERGVGLLDQFYSGQLNEVEPGNGRLNGFDNLWSRMVDPHEETDDPHTLIAAERNL